MGKERNTAQRQEAFLAALERGASVRDAALHAGVARSTVYEWAEDLDFKERWESAEAKPLRQLRNKAFEVAMGGSARMLIFLLQHYDKVTFGGGQEAEPEAGVSEIVVVGVGGSDGGAFISYEPASARDGDGAEAPLGSTRPAGKQG